MSNKKKKKARKKQMRTTFIKIRREWALRHYEVEQAIWHTQAFKQFCENNKDRVIKELEDRRQYEKEIYEQALLYESLHEQAWLELPELDWFDEALRMAFLNEMEDNHLRGAFLRMFSYEELKLRLDKLLPQIELSSDEVLDSGLRSAFMKTVQFDHIFVRYQDHLFPHEMAIWFDRKLYPGVHGIEVIEKYLNLRLDLSFSKERLKAEFDYILDEWHHKVKQRPRPHRGAEIMEVEEIGLMYRVYELVEEQLAVGKRLQESMFMATKQLYGMERLARLGNPYAKQVKKLYTRAKKNIGDM